MASTLLEGAAEVTKAAGLDVYKMVEGIQRSVSKTQSGLIPLAQLSQSRRAAAELLTLLLQSVKVCRHSASLALLLTREKLVWVTVTWARCCWKKTPSVSHSWLVTNLSLLLRVRSVLLKRRNKVRKEPLRVILNGLGKDAAQIIARVNGFTYVETEMDYYTGEVKEVFRKCYSKDANSLVQRLTATVQMTLPKALQSCGRKA